MSSHPFQLRRVVPTDAVTAQLVRPLGTPAHVVTLVDTGLRWLVEQGVSPGTPFIHADSADQVLNAVREKPIGAVLVSTSTSPNELRSVRKLVAKCAGAKAIALIDEYQTPAPNVILYLGSCGVSEVVDLSSADGWNRLRHVLTANENELAARIAGVVDDTLLDGSVGTRRFFNLLIRSAPRITSVRDLCGELDVEPTTITSRFFRAKLPSPKGYLASMRIVYVRALLESPNTSIAAVANQMRYSSPQSLGRHVLKQLGMTPGALRRDCSFPQVLALFISTFIVPFRKEWRTFCPFGEKHAAGIPSYHIH
jgi:AraC-like DNA-binding protein